MTKANINNVRVLNTIVEQIIHVAGANNTNTYYTLQPVLCFCNYQIYIYIYIHIYYIYRYIYIFLLVLSTLDCKVVF